MGVCLYFKYVIFAIAVVSSVRRVAAWQGWVSVPRVLKGNVRRAVAV